MIASTKHFSTKLLLEIKYSNLSLINGLKLKSRDEKTWLVKPTFARSRTVRIHFTSSFLYSILVMSTLSSNIIEHRVLVKR